MLRVARDVVLRVVLCVTRAASRRFALQIALQHLDGQALQVVQPCAHPRSKALPLLRDQREARQVAAVQASRVRRHQE